MLAQKSQSSHTFSLGLGLNRRGLECLLLPPLTMMRAPGETLLQNPGNQRNALIKDQGASLEEF